MMKCEDPNPPSEHRTIVVAVVTAALTTAATSLASWLVDELRARYGRPKPPDGGTQ